MTKIKTGSDGSTENQCSPFCKTEKSEDSSTPWWKPEICQKVRKFERIPYRYTERKFNDEKPENML